MENLNERIYDAEVVLGKEIIRDQGASDNAIKLELYSTFVDGAETPIPSIIDEMKEIASGDEDKFAKMINKNIRDYMKFINIDRDSINVEDHEDVDFSVVSFDFTFDFDKAMKKANKDFKQQQTKSTDSIR